LRFAELAKQGDLGNAACNICVPLETEGPLNADILAKAFSTVVSRHESLNCTYDLKNLKQMILNGNEAKVEFFDAFSKGANAWELHLKNWLAQPFDLKNPPFMKLCVARFSENSHRLVFLMHHLACDGVGATVLLEEVVTSYTALLQGRAPELPVVAPFVQQSVLLDAHLRESIIPSAANFWNSLFKNKQADFKSFRGEKKYLGARCSVELDEEDLRGIKKIAAKNKSTLFMLLLACYQKVLRQEFEDENFSVGVPFASRPLRGTERLVANCVNILPVPCLPTKNEDFLVTLNKMKEFVKGLYQHCDYPFMRLKKQLQETGIMGEVPFVSTFNLEPRTQIPQFPGLTTKWSAVSVPLVEYPFMLNVIDAGSRLFLEADFSLQCFDEEKTYVRLNNLKSLLKSIL
jgi:NRPS condensation-like uncharacterized protein